MDFCNLVVAQKGGVTASPTFLVANPMSVTPAIVLGMKRAEPSANRELNPPVCLLPNPQGAEPVTAFNSSGAVHVTEIEASPTMIVFDVPSVTSWTFTPFLAPVNMEVGLTRTR